jgi:uncharacterized protein with NAD-binding domain and iron-sulfur cluster
VPPTNQDTRNTGLVPNAPVRKQRVLVLGAGPAGLAAAAELSGTPGLRARFDVTVLQVGWRAGGKCTSGRTGAFQEVDLNGTHFLFGCYDNALGLMRQAYDELKARGDTKSGTYEQALLARNTVVCRQFFQGQWTNWEFELPSDGLLPGAGAPHEYLRSVVKWALSTWRHGRTDVLGEVVAESWKVMDEAVVLLERFLTEAHGLPERLVLKAVAEALETLRALTWKLVDSRVATHLKALRFWILVDLLCTTAIGMIEDDVFGPDGFAVCDGRNYRDWLQHHGASELSYDSPIVAMWYDAVAAFECGDVNRPNLSAGVSLEALFRAIFTYKGAFAWQMQAEVGESVIAPIVQALKYRGVKFRFFHRVWNVVPKDGRIDKLVVERQVELASGDPDSYEPFIEVEGRRAWPSEPRYEQLATPGVKGHDLESFYTDWRGTMQELRYGEHFDSVVFAMPVGVVPFYCKELLAEREEWRQMVRYVPGVETQSLRLNLKLTLPELGWPGPVPIVSANPPPMSTWEDCSPLIAVETWPEGLRPKAIDTVFGALPASEEPPGPEDHGYPARQWAVARDNALNFLQNSAGLLWPGAKSTVNPEGIDWNQLVDPLERTGPERLKAQTIKANVGPTERYTMAIAGGLQHRLRPEGSGYANLVLAGDWVRNGLDIGCVEGAVMAGKQAAQALSRRASESTQPQVSMKKAQVG